MHGEKIGDVIMELRMKKGMTLLALNRNMVNIVNPLLDMIIEEGDKRGIRWLNCLLLHDNSHMDGVK